MSACNQYKNIAYAPTAFALPQTTASPLRIERRNTLYGWIACEQPSSIIPITSARARWHAAESVLLPQLLAANILPSQPLFKQSHMLYESLLDGDECEALLDAPPYLERWQQDYEMLSSSFDAADGQQIVRIDFDAKQGEVIVAEELWMKASWLSFDEEDPSLRFRFSFGMDGYEDVGADFSREQHAATLAERIFPESTLIANSTSLAQWLCDITDAKRLAFVERIIYFNAPNGGAQFHQDVEPGHLGIVFAQLTGRTAWLSLSKSQLVQEISIFLQQDQADDLLKRAKLKAPLRRELAALAQMPTHISKLLDAPDRPALEALINSVPDFFAQLVNRGYAYIISPGDVLLLPQHDLQHCNWHSVFCLDDEPGEALSFAVREIP